MQTIEELVDCWPSVASFAKSTGIDRKHVTVMKIRRRIHSDHWQGIIDGARSTARACRAIGDVKRAMRLERVDAALLLSLHEAIRASEKASA